MRGPHKAPVMRSRFPGSHRDTVPQFGWQSLPQDRLTVSSGHTVLIIIACGQSGERYSGRRSLFRNGSSDIPPFWPATRNSGLNGLPCTDVWTRQSGSGS